MARIKNVIFGSPEGKLGKIVYRTVNGKTFASVRPEKYNASQSEAAKSNRTRFGIAIQFAKYINSIPELSKIWKSAKIKGTTSFNKIVKYNIKSITNSNLSVYNIITPGSLNSFVDTNNISFDNKTITLSIRLNGKVKTTEINSPILIYAVVAFQNPKPKNKIPILITHISQEISSKEVEETVELKLNLNNNQKSLALKYKSCIIYLTTIIDSPFPKKIIYSPTRAELFPLT